MPPQAEGDQQIIQNFERREFVFVDDLAEAEHLLGALARPCKILDRPMHEDALEGLGLCQPDAPMLLRIPKRQQGRAQHGRMREVRMVV